MNRSDHMSLQLERFLIDYRELLVSFSHSYEPSATGQAAHPRYFQVYRELPYILFFLQYMQSNPLELLEATEKYGLLRQLARALDYHENENRRAVA